MSAPVLNPQIATVGGAVAPPSPTGDGAVGGSFHIASLDGIRALSFLIVFVAHAGLEKWAPGYLGLTSFFFLSGYLITTLLRREAERSGGINLPAFYVRRVLRIFPPFYVVLILALMLAALGVLRGPADLHGWPYQALHLTNYYIIHSGWWDGLAPGTWVYWSLAVEEHFYLVFPFLYLLLRRSISAPGRQALILLGLCAAVLAWRCWLVFALHAPKDRLYVATDTRIDSILFGCILALWSNPALDLSPFSERQWKRGWLPAGVGLLLLSVIFRHPLYDQTVRYTLQGIALIPIFYVAVRYPTWGAFRLLNQGWARWIGALSYSLYLLHTAVIYGVRQWTILPPLLQGLLSLGIGILLAVGIRYAVEEPCARLRKRFSSGAQQTRRLDDTSAPQSAPLPTGGPEGRPAA
ncbi:MAG: acyltransferase family protein [Actinomycetota bacterium]